MMKRRFDNFGGYGKKQRYEQADNEVKLLIHHKAAGAIIGKGGENIKKLRADYEGINVNIPDTATPERVLIVDGPEKEKVVDVIGELLTRLDEVHQERLGGENSEIRVIIHASYAGAVIGRGGARINELRDETSTELKVYQERCPYSTERVIKITGAHDDVKNCVAKIMDICIDAPVKGEWSPYDSSNYDPTFVDQYGGYQLDSTFRPPPGRTPAFAGSMGYRGRGGSMGGPPGMGGGRGGGFGGPGMGGMGMGGMGAGMGGMRGPVGGYGGPGMGGAGGGGGGETTQVTLPKMLAGTIIGKGGDRINQVRQQSGANIAIDDDKSGGAEELIITIQGSPDQTQYAQYLLQQCVRQSPQGQRYIQGQAEGRPVKSEF